MILLERIYVTGSLVRFIKSDTNGTRFIQVFEAGDAEVFRLCVAGNLALDSARISVFKHGKHVEAQVYRMHTLDKEGNRLPVLSLRLPRNSVPFVVRRNGRTVARLKQETYERLVAKRNIDMVNPSIDGAYPEWSKEHNRHIEQNAPDIQQMAFKPLFSIIVPLFQTPIPFFHDMVNSVLSQTYEAWELILVNASPECVELQEAIRSYSDERIRIVPLEENLGIAGNTNVGIQTARGDYISFFDHDDMLNRNILAYYAQAINDNRSIDLLYCDEDNFHESPADRYAPMLKPDFNLDLLYSHNYIVHMLTISRKAIEQVDLSPTSTSGAQDYDLTLKIAEVARAIHHVPYILYHWRAHAGSTNGGVMESKPYAIQASIEALSAHFERRGVVTEVEPTDINCVFRERYERDRISDSVLRVDIGLNEHWGEVALSSAKTTASRLLLLTVPNLTFYDESAIDELCGCLGRPEAGVVAPKVYYPDGLIQSCGLVLDEHGAWHLLNQNFTSHMGGGYHGFSECSCNYSAVGPTCMMVAVDDLLRHADTLRHLRSALDFSIVLSSLMRSDGKLCTVLPHIEAQCDAPVLWDQCDLEHAYTSGRKASKLELDLRQPATCQSDVLANQNLTFESGYPQLHVGRDRAAAVQQILLTRQRRSIIDMIVER